MKKGLRFWLLTMALLLGMAASAQTQKRTVDKRLQSYFLNYKAPHADIGTCRLVKTTIDAKKRTLLIEANENFAHQTFRPEDTERIYQELRKVLPGPVNYYKLTLKVKDKTIDELIPNEFRKKKDPSRQWENADYRGTPWVTNLSKPYTVKGGLKNRHLSINPSHGRIFKNEEQQWIWQRPALFCTREDLLSQSIVIPYLIPMLEKAGAVVFTTRERDSQPLEVIVDNDTCGHRQGLYVEEAGAHTLWQTDTLGFALPQPVLRGQENPFRQGSSRVLHTGNGKNSTLGAALWTPNIPETGRYAVYVTYQTSPTSISDAHYRVLHKGGITHFQINQQMGGGTWVYLGTFDFEKGQSPQGMVVLTNESDQQGTVSADAVRFGGGRGRVDRGQGTSGLPRYFEGAKYNAQWNGFPYERYSNYNGTNDYAEDINCRSLVANRLMGGSVYCPDSMGLKVPLELCFCLHTDAGVREDNGLIGSLGICTTEYNNGVLGNGQLSRYASRDMADRLMSDLQHDIEATYPTPWTSRGIWNKSYSESRLPDVPSMILELLSHQNYADMRLAHDPRFKFTVARSIYKSLLREVSYQHNLRYTVQPLPVTHFAIERSGKQHVTLSWHPQKDPLEPTAKADAYVLYTATEETGYDNGQLLKGTSCKLELVPDQLYRFQITAVNEGGESFPSETLAACLAKDNEATVLVVNGFQRIEGPARVEDEQQRGFDLTLDPGVPYLRTSAFCGQQTVFDRRRAGLGSDTHQLGASGDELTASFVAGNTFDYPVVHGEAIRASGFSFVSCSRQAVEEEEVKLTDYAAVDVIFGLQKADRTDTLFTQRFDVLPPHLRKRLSAYAEHGGRLLVSGSYIGADAAGNVATESFLRQVLRCNYGGTLTDWEEQTVMGLGRTLEIPRWLNAEQYAVSHPEWLQPEADAFACLAYGKNRHCAAVAYRGKHRAVTMGFPFESIRSKADRANIMASLLDFLTNAEQVPK